MRIPLGTALRIQRSAEKAALEAFEFPSLEKIAQGEIIRCDPVKLYTVFRALYLLVAGLQRYYMRKYLGIENEKKLSERWSTEEILSILKLKQYTGSAPINALEGEPDFLKPSPFVDEFLQDYTVELTESYAEFADKITEELRGLIWQGKPLKEIRDTVQTKFNIAKARANAIAVTETTRAYVVGELISTYDSEVIQGYEFIAVLDDLTTPMCRARHKMVIPASDPTMIALNSPPLHVNCRSHLVPFTIYDKASKWLDSRQYERMVSRDEKLVPLKREQDITLIENLLKGITRRPPMAPVAKIPTLTPSKPKPKKMTPEEYAREVLGVECDYRGIEPQVHEEINKVLSRLKEEYPQVWKDFNGVIPTKYSRDMWREVYRRWYPDVSDDVIEELVTKQMQRVKPYVIAYTSDEIDKIVLKSTRWKDMQAIEKAERGIRGFTVCDKITDVIYHEFGHRVEYYLVKKRKQTAFVEFLKKMEDKNLFPMAEHAVSRYAADSHSECLAELFAAQALRFDEAKFKGTPQAEIIKEFRKWLKEVLK